MNYITVAMFALTVLPVVLGLLLGFARGSKYSIARLIVVALCLIAALLLREPVTNWLMNIDVGGQTIQNSIVSQLPENLASLGDTIVMFVKLLVGALLFVVLFAVLRLLTALILGPILKAICKSRSKGRLGGGLVGLIQGVLVALVICIPLSGVLTEINSVAQTEAFKQTQNTTAYVMPIGERLADVDSDGVTVPEPTTGGENDQGGNTPDIASVDFVELLDGYANSTIGKLYSAVGAKPFEAVSSMNVDGKKYTLSGQVDAITGGLDMMYALQRLGEMGDIMDNANLSTVTDVFETLDQVWSEMPSEAKETVVKVIDAVAKESDLPIDLSVIDYENISFKNEGEIFGNLQKESEKLNGKEEITLDDVKTIIEESAKSDIILPLLASAVDNSTDGPVFNFTEETKVEVKNYIQGLDVSDEKKEMLEKFCGVTSQD